jgi:hypothetical protein
VDWEREAGRLAAGSLAEGSPTAWFDRLYRGAVAGVVSMPWDRDAPSPPLAAWAPERVRAGDRAAVVGCGLGADAEFLAGSAPTCSRSTSRRRPWSWPPRATPAPG